jgi:hypothetical protein
MRTPSFRRPGTSEARKSVEHVVRRHRAELVLDVQQDVVLLRVRDRVESQHRAFRPQVEVGVPDPQRLAVLNGGPQHPDVGGADRGRSGRVGILPRRAEADEVRVGVQDQQRQAGPEEQLLEHHAECIGLSRAALTAPERVPPATVVDAVPDAAAQPVVPGDHAALQRIIGRLEAREEDQRKTCVGNVWAVRCGDPARATPTPGYMTKSPE